MSTKLDPVKSTPYMSVVEGRRPRQKVHTSLSHAKNAFDTPKANPLVKDKRGYYQHTHGWGAIFEHIHGDWVMIYEITQPTEQDLMPNSRYGNEYETRPWRRNDRQPLPAVRTATDPQAEPAPGARSHVGRVHEGSYESGVRGDDQRASRSEHDLQVGLTREEAVAELQRSRHLYEQHKTRFAERGFQYDLELMLRFEGRMYGLMWVVERMPRGKSDTE